MEYREIKQILQSCADLKGFDEGVIALLFWRGSEKTIKADSVIYSEETGLDDTFCLLLTGDLVVEKARRVVGQIGERQIFGEMAYFTPLHQRTATVRVHSPQATVLQIQLTRSELASPAFSSLKKQLGLQAWDRFVSSSQSRP